MLAPEASKLGPLPLAWAFRIMPAMKNRTAVFSLRCLLPLLAAGPVVACGTGGVGNAVRPKETSASEALEEGKCQGVGDGGEPLVVDWKPEQRGDLEIAMKEGVAVVSYSCEGIKLLKECHLEGNYGYMGMTRKEQVVRLANSDEVRANLPLSGAKLSAELKRGSSLDVAMVMVGKQKTTWSEPTKADLKGSCDGATHFVRGATVGAFVMETNTSGEAKAAAAFFGAETGGASASKRQVQNKDGDLSACKSATSNASNAPDQCGAPVRLLLVPMAKEKPADDKAPKAPSVELAKQEGGCPAGLVLAEGKCTKAADAPAYQCKPGDAKECQAQCDKNHAGSCGALGVMLATGDGAAQDATKAAQLFEKACAGGDTPSCVNQGRMLADGSGAAKNEAKAAELFDKACADGVAEACGFLGTLLLEGRGVGKDLGKAAEKLKLGCEGGHDRSCGRAARLYASGDGVTQDLATALQLYLKACRGADGAACGELAQMYEYGKGTGKNAINAEMYYRRGCFMGNGEACADLGRLEAGKPGGGGDGAKRSFTMACQRMSSFGCATMKLLYGGSTPFVANPKDTMEWRSACTKNDLRACTRLGVVTAASGQKAGATMDLQRACTGGDQFACLAGKALK